MSVNFQTVFVLALLTTLLGCASADINHARILDSSKENIAKIKDIANLRAARVAENETFFTERLKCIGSGKELKKLALRISVAPIYDKTGKVFPPGSTAISDMVINSLSYVGAINVVETPLSGDLTESRTNIMSKDYVHLSTELKKNVVNIATKNGHIPFGALFPSNLHIAGALIEYDEGTEIPSPSTRLDIDALSLRKDTNVITAGLNLRLINSIDGEVLSNSDKGKRGSVILSSRFYKVNVANSLYKIISSRQFGLDYSVVVADPKHYVIQELVEKGVAELLLALPNEKVCDEVNHEFK